MTTAYWTAAFWFLLAIAFGRYGLMNLRAARIEFPLSTSRPAIKTENGLPTGAAEQVKSHNDLVNYLNKEWREANRIAGWAQLGSAGLALVSAATTLLPALMSYFL